MKYRLLKLLVALPMIAWALLGLRIASSGFGSREFQTRFVWFVCACALTVCCLAGLVFAKTRWIAAACLLIVVAFTFALMEFRHHRLTSGIRQLEAVYDEIASSGPPFPLSIERSSYPSPDYLHWYYQRNSEASFGIAYIVASNGWAIEYPEGTCRFIGYRPNGYEPNQRMQRTDSR